MKPMSYLREAGFNTFMCQDLASKEFPNGEILLITGLLAVQLGKKLKNYVRYKSRYLRNRK